MIWTMEMEGWTILNTPLWRQDLGSQEHEADLVSHIPAQEASTPPENQEADGPEKHTLEQPAHQLSQRFGHTEERAWLRTRLPLPMQ